MGDFVAYRSRWRLVLLFLGALSFVALGIWMVGTFGEVPTSQRHSAAYTMTVGWLGIIFFGFCALVIVRRFLDERAQLQIGPAGIRWSPWSDQLIPWAEIIDVTVWSHRGQRVIILHLEDPARFPGRGLTARLAGANRLLTGGDIAISLTGTDRTHDEAMAAIGHFRGLAARTGSTSSIILEQ